MAKPRIEPPREPEDRLTPSQRRAVAARGNVLVVAGAGAGKTHTLVERCLDCLFRERASLDEILVVTFTEAAATEMRRRLRSALEARLDSPQLGPFCAEQLVLFDAALIGTLHSFCFRIVRENFYSLELDPQSAVLDEGQARLVAGETLEELLGSHYEGHDDFSAGVRSLIRIYGGGQDEKIRDLVLRLHHYVETRADAAGWLAREMDKFSAREPAGWRAQLLEAIAAWRNESLPRLEALQAGNAKAGECREILARLPQAFSRAQAAKTLDLILQADGHWPAGKKTALRLPLGKFFADAEFLDSLAPVEKGVDPLAADWEWSRGQMLTLLRLAREFTVKFSERKRNDGLLDFHDLEQFALKVLWDFSTNAPTAAAARWRHKLRFVFVDEYQDINAAQDRIIQALSREDGPSAGPNRFLVGDVKQSIYRFRLAEPAIFRGYAESWRGGAGQTIPLAENFRSREGLLHFVNSVFGLLMRPEIGGVAYDDEARLQFGSPAARAAVSAARDPAPRVELLLRLESGRAGNSSEEETGADGLAGLDQSEKEARLLARRLGELKASGHPIRDEARQAFRAAEWRDFAVLLRAPAGKAEVFAREFERAGVPLQVERGGFYDSREVLDWLSLLQCLDNPLQDIPLIAVLRSPLVALSLDELAEIRLAAKDVHFWTALNRVRNPPRPIRDFLGRYPRWRTLARQASLSQCLGEILAETQYEDWLGAQPRGAQRRANLAQLLNLARKFDQFQRQGLYRFLKFIEAQREAEVEPEAAPATGENAVRLMSIHQSKGLEFPVVALADLGKRFNEQDLYADIIFDGELGLCPRVKPPQSGGRYPSLAHWLARRRQRRELLGEELRLLYVAMTRARDTLILSGNFRANQWKPPQAGPAEATLQQIDEAGSFADWLGLWFASQAPDLKEGEARRPGAAASGESPLLRWRIVDDAELAETAARRPEAGAAEELPPLDRVTAERLRSVLDWDYSHPAATRQAAKSSVTALRREARALDDEAQPAFVPEKFRRGAAPRRPAAGGLSAAEAGEAHHKFLECLSLAAADDLKGLEAESKRLESEKILSPEQAAALDLEAVAAFWRSETGANILQQSANVRRELPFTAAFSPVELAQITGAAADAALKEEFVVVQGVADLVVLLPGEIWLLDFKTDKIPAGELAEKTRVYAPQLKLYGRALEKIYSRPTARRWLHFLSARRTVTVESSAAHSSSASSSG